MKITDEMVERACEADYRSVDHNWKDDPSESERIAQRREMRRTLEAVFADLNRWALFSDEEVREISAAESDRSCNPALPEELRERAYRIAEEVLAEDRRRIGGYQGPGVYKSASGSEWKVIGRLGESGPIVMSAPESEHFLYSEEWGDFNFFHASGTPAYRYLRPLES